MRNAYLGAGNTKLPFTFYFAASLIYVGIISLMDLTGVASVAAARSFAIYELYITAGIIYLIVTYGILYIFKKVEYRLSGHLRDRAENTELPVTPVLR